MEKRFLSSLLNTEVYPEKTFHVRLIQTHVSFIFITDSFVYKVKKAVDLGFLNFSTLDRRRFYCNEEVRLNRRLCPDMYLGVVEIRESVDGYTFKGDGKVVDYAVKMQRLPEERMLDRLLMHGLVTSDDLSNIARTIANFHLNADRNAEIDCYGTIESIKRNWEENFQQLSEYVNITLTGKEFLIIKEWGDTFLENNGETFTERISGGFIRDCDGDIHLENICLTNKVWIFDCIEFNYRFRYSDTAADIAFLLMDLDYHGAREFSERFLTEYIELTEDRSLTEVIDFYKIYRAVVRGKVESLKLKDPNIAEEDKQSARERANRYFRLARGYIVRRRLPLTLFLTCGLMGSGKSFLAKELAFELGIDLADSDSIRKELNSIAISEHCYEGYDQGIYAPAINEATYRELLSRCEKSLAIGKSIIADATFRRQKDRLNFCSTAQRLNAGCLILHTTCPEKMLKSRLDSRQLKPDEISDGRWELYARQRDEFEPLTSNEGCLINLDTSRPLSDNIDDLLKALGML